MEYIISIYAAVIGAVMGSFIGAMAWRLHSKRGVLNERSECEHCHHQLRVIDLLPIISWLSLAGKCRYCKKPIGRTAIILELGTAVIFVLSYILWPLPLVTVLDWLYLILWLVSVVGLVFLWLYDLRHYLLPNIVVWPLAAIGLVMFGIRMIQQDASLILALQEAVLSLLPVTGLYGLLYAVSGGKWVGFGDVKLGIYIGLALGWPLALLAMMLANLVGTLYILPGLLSGVLARNSRIPFGPFLIIGTILAMLFGQSIIDGYIGRL